MSFLEKIKNSVDEYVDGLAIKDLEYKVRMILREREEYKSWTDKELSLATLAFKDDIKKGAKLDSLIVPAFALVNEAARRILGQSPFDVQILGGLVIHSGNESGRRQDINRNNAGIFKCAGRERRTHNNHQRLFGGKRR